MFNLHDPRIGEFAVIPISEHDRKIRGERERELPASSCSRNSFEYPREGKNSSVISRCQWGLAERLLCLREAARLDMDK